MSTNTTIQPYTVMAVYKDNDQQFWDTVYATSPLEAMRKSLKNAFDANSGNPYPISNLRFHTILNGHLNNTIAWAAHEEPEDPINVDELLEEWTKVNDCDNDD